MICSDKCGLSNCLKRAWKISTIVVRIVHGVIEAASCFPKTFFCGYGEPAQKLESFSGKVELLHIYVLQVHPTEAPAKRSRRHWVELVSCEVDISVRATIK